MLPAGTHILLYWQISRFHFRYENLSVTIVTEHIKIVHSFRAKVQEIIIEHKGYEIKCHFAVPSQKQHAAVLIMWS